MRLSGSDCLRRGFRSLRVNWALVPLLLLRSAICVPLVSFGTFLPLRAVGFDPSSLGDDLLKNPEQAQSQIQDLLGSLTAGSSTLIVALVAMLAVWTLAALLYCYFEAGLYGVLVAADASVTGGDSGAAAAAPRAFTLRGFHLQAMRYAGRFFSFVNFSWAVFLLPILLFVLWLLPVVSAGMRWGLGAGLLLGGVGALLAGALGAALFGWANLAQADLARAGSGTSVASRRGYAILIRRPGVVALLIAVFLSLLLVCVPPLAVVSFVAQLLTSGVPGLSGAVSFASLLLESLPTALLSVLFGAAFVALVRSESRGEAPDIAEALPA